MKESSMSTKKHSATASKEYVVEDVIQEKKKVYLIISGKKIALSIDNYLSDYYYPGKIISKEKYNELKDSENKNKAQEYLSYLLTHGRYTKKALKDKIKSKTKLSDDDIDNLIKPYIENGVINDKEYVLDYLEAKVEQGYGRNYLIQDLKKRGVNDSLLKDQEIDNYLNFGENKIIQLIEKENQKKTNIPLRKRKENILSLLLRRGFDYAFSKESIDSFYQSYKENKKDSETKLNLLKKEGRKCYNQLLKKYPDPQKRKSAFYQSLWKKGFERDEIEELCQREEYTFHD